MLQFVFSELRYIQISYHYLENAAVIKRSLFVR
jgi:hypothetical protein